MEQNYSTALYKRLEVNLKKLIVESTAAFDYPEFGTVAKKFKNQFQDSKERQWTYFEVFQQQDTRELLARVRKHLIEDLFVALEPELQKLYDYNDGDSLSQEILSYECMRNLGDKFDGREPIILNLINEQESAQAQTEEGKRKRVMSTQGVLAVLSTIVEPEIKKQVKCERAQKKQEVQSYDSKQESRKEQIEPKEPISQITGEVPRVEDKIKITKMALKQLINKHFIIVDDDEEQKLQRPINKKQKLRIAQRLQPSSSSSDSSD